MRVADCRACDECPLRGDGSQQYTPDQLKHGAQVEVRFQTPDESRSALPRLERDYYKLAGLAPERVSISHAVRCGTTLPPAVSSVQWEAGKRGPLELGIRFCDSKHGRAGSRDTAGVPLTVAMGDLALQSATGQRSSHEWRGWLLPYQSKSDRWLSDIWTPGPGDLSTLAMVPLGDLRGLPTLGYAMRADWKKVGRILRGEWPVQWPGFHTEPPKQWPRVSAFDTEFTVPEGILERYSLYDGGERPWVIEAHSIRELELPGDVTVVMHNVEADIGHLQKFLRGSGQAIRTEDTMLMHSVLWSDLPHSLEYLGSLYGRTNRWKHLYRRNPLVYSGGDALGTWDVYVGLVREMQVDPQSAWVYRHAVFPLTGIIMEAETVGLKVDQWRVLTALRHHLGLQLEVQLESEAYCGYPINMGSSDQVSRWLYEVEHIGQKKKHR